MIIWGSRGGVVDLGPVGARNCLTCEKERNYRLTLQYRYGHLYYIFGFVTKKQYICACEVCKRGNLVDAKEVEPKLTKNPIPFIHRLGWTILVGLIAASFAK